MGGRATDGISHTLLALKQTFNALSCVLDMVNDLLSLIVQDLFASIGFI